MKTLIVHIKVTTLHLLVSIFVNFHASLVREDVKEGVGEPLATIWFSVTQQIIGKQTV